MKLNLDALKTYLSGFLLTTLLSVQLSAAEPLTSESAQQQLQQLSQQILQSPQDTGLLLQRGKVYFLLHDFDKAIHDYNTALAKNPNLAEAYFGRGMALGRTGKIREGIADLSVFIEHRPNSSVGYTKRGVRYLWLGDRDKAEQDLRKAISLNPKNAEAHDDLGVIFAQKGDFKTALSHFRQTISHDPSYQKGYHNMALGYFLSNDAPMALTYIDQAIKLQPANRNSLLLKAEILTAMGRVSEANAIKDHAEFLPEGNWSEEAPTPN